MFCPKHSEISPPKVRKGKLIRRQIKSNIFHKRSRHVPYLWWKIFFLKYLLTLSYKLHFQIAYPFIRKASGWHHVWICPGTSPPNVHYAWSSWSWTTSTSTHVPVDTRYSPTIRFRLKTIDHLSLKITLSPKEFVQKMASFLNCVVLANMFLHGM